MREPRNLAQRTGIWLATGYIALLPEVAGAAGFQVRTGSPDWTANAFAGMAAKGYDASTAWSNPAAMTLLPDSELASGLNAIVPSASSSVTDIELGMVTAYRIDEHISIGGGPIVDYFQTRLTSAINIGPTAALTGDPIADIHDAKDWSGGYHIGTLYEFDSGLRPGSITAREFANTLTACRPSPSRDCSPRSAPRSPPNSLPRALMSIRA
jgi:long-subunit fatty acid transport protein